MVSGAHKVWTNAVLRTGPATILGRSLFCFDKAKLGESLSHALARRSAETERFEAALFTFACIERFVGMPEPPILIREAIGEMAENYEKVALCVRECPTQMIAVERDVRSKKKVRVLIVRFPVLLTHIVH